MMDNVFWGPLYFTNCYCCYCYLIYLLLLLLITVVNISVVNIVIQTSETTHFNHYAFTTRSQQNGRRSRPCLNLAIENW